MTEALVVVDLQNDYFSGGAMPLNDTDRAAANAARLLERFRAKSQPLVHLRHLSVRPGATFFIPGTSGAEIHRSVAPLAGETVIDKNFPNGFRDTGLLDHLRQAGVDEVVICGAMSHMCIDATTRAAFDLGFRCTVAHDGCTTRDLEFDGRPVPAAAVHAAFMAALAVPYARVLDCDGYLAAD
jgi:nicotinamidase-related amidase